MREVWRRYGESVQRRIEGGRVQRGSVVIGKELRALRSLKRHPQESEVIRSSRGSSLARNLTQGQAALWKAWKTGHRGELKGSRNQHASHSRQQLRLLFAFAPEMTFQSMRYLLLSGR